MEQDSLPTLLTLTKQFNEQLVGSLSDTFVNLPLLSWDDGVIGLLVKVSAVLGILKIAPLLFSNKDSFFSEGMRFIIVSWLLAGMYGKIDSRSAIWDFNLPPKYDYSVDRGSNQSNKINYKKATWNYAYKGGGYSSFSNKPTIDRDIINASAWFFDTLAAGIELQIQDYEGKTISGGAAQKHIVDEMMLFLDQSRLARKYCTLFKGDKVKYLGCLQTVISPNLSINKKNQVMCGNVPCLTEEELKPKKEDPASKRTITGFISSFFVGSLDSLTSLTTDITGSIVFPTLMWILEFLKQVFSLGLIVLYTFLTAGVLVMFKMFAPLALISNQYFKLMKTNFKTLLATTMFGFVMQFFQTFTTILLLGVKNATYIVVVNFLLKSDVNANNIAEFSLKAEVLMNLAFIGVFIALFAQVVALFKVPRAAEALASFNISAFMKIGKEAVTGAIAFAAGATALVGVAAAAAAAIPALMGAAAAAGPAISGMMSIGSKIGASTLGQAAKSGASKIGSGISSRNSRMKDYMGSSRMGAGAMRAGKGFVKSNANLYGDFLSRNVLGDEGASKLRGITGGKGTASQSSSGAELPEGKDLKKENESGLYDSLKAESKDLDLKAESGTKDDSRNNKEAKDDKVVGEKKKSTTAKAMKMLGKGAITAGFGGFNALASVFEAGMTGKTLSLGDVFKGGILKSSKTSGLVGGGLSVAGSKARKFSNKAVDSIAENPEASTRLKNFSDSLDSSYSVKQMNGYSDLTKSLAQNEVKGHISLDNQSLMSTRNVLERKIRKGEATPQEMSQFQNVSDQLKVGNDYSELLKDISTGQASNNQYEEAYKMSKSYSLSPEANQAMSQTVEKNEEFAKYKAEKDREVALAIKSAQNKRNVESIGQLNTLVSDGYVANSELNVGKFDKLSEKSFDTSVMSTLNEGTSAKGLSMFNEITKDMEHVNKVGSKGAKAQALDRKGFDMKDKIDYSKRYDSTKDIVSNLISEIGKKDSKISLSNGIDIHMDNNTVSGIMFSNKFSEKQKEEKVNSVVSALEDFAKDKNLREEFYSDAKLDNDEADKMSMIHRYLNKIK